MIRGIILIDFNLSSMLFLILNFKDKNDFLSFFIISIFLITHKQISFLFQCRLDDN